MRSVFVHFWNTTQDVVAATLDDICPGPRDPWIVYVGDDPRLWIYFYADGPSEDEDWGERFAALGGPPAVSVVIDISGRFEG